MAPRPPRFFHHSIGSIAHKPRLPLIASLGADPVLPTQCSKVSSSHRFAAKLKSLIHRLPLFPGHWPDLSHQLPAHQSVTYVLNLLCYLCSEPVPTSAGRSQDIRNTFAS